MSAFDVTEDPCSSCPDGPRTKGGACDNTKAQWLCDFHFVTYARAHASCKNCWAPSGALKNPQKPNLVVPSNLPDGTRRGWR